MAGFLFSTERSRIGIIPIDPPFLINLSTSSNDPSLPLAQCFAFPWSFDMGVSVPFLPDWICDTELVLSLRLKLGAAPSTDIPMQME